MFSERFDRVSKKEGNVGRVGVFIIYGHLSLSVN